MKSLKKFLYFMSAKARSKFVLRVIKWIYRSTLVSSGLSGSLERMFDPNNIRRAGNWRISTTWVEITTNSGCQFKLRLDDHVDWKMFLNGE
jgi:hypothetical protein